MKIVESLRRVESQIFKDTNEVHDLVGAYLAKDVDKNKLQEMLNNKDVKSITKLLEGVNMEPEEINNLLDEGGTNALERELLNMPVGSTASFIGQDFFGYFETTGTKTGENNWHLISYGLSGEREGEYFDEIKYSSSRNFAYWANHSTTGYDYVPELTDDDMNAGLWYESLEEGKKGIVKQMWDGDTYSYHLYVDGKNIGSFWEFDEVEDFAKDHDIILEESFNLVENTPDRITKKFNSSQKAREFMDSLPKEAEARMEQSDTEEEGNYKTWWEVSYWETPSNVDESLSWENDHEGGFNSLANKILPVNDLGIMTPNQLARVEGRRDNLWHKEDDRTITPEEEEELKELTKKIEAHYMKKKELMKVLR